MTEADSSEVPSGLSDVQEPGQARRTDLFAAIWRALIEPWLLVILASVLAISLSTAYALPQLPGQARNEAGASQRWLADAADAAGALGSLWRSLGLFDVLHSPLVQASMALMGLVLLVQLANLALNAVAMYRLPGVLDEAGTNGEPLMVHLPATLLRWRHSHADQPLSVSAHLLQLLELRFRHVDRRTMRVSPALTIGATNTPSTENAQADATTLEERLLALRGQQAALLRPFLALGMLCGLTVIWLNAAYGWDYRPAALTPGEQFSEPVYNVKLEYMLAQPNPNVLVPSLLASIDGEQAPLPLGPDMVAQINGVDIRAQPDAPALVVRTVDGSALLARPGQETPVNSIGLSFPSAGSEETVLLPRQAIGLRIVRLDQGTADAADDAFQVEVYRSGSDEAVARSVVGSSQIETITAAGENVSLALVPLPSLSIQVRRAPGLWLVWVALALATVGLLGYRQQPGFVLAQIGPWPENRSVVTVQSNLTEEMGPIRHWHEEM